MSCQNETLVCGYGMGMRMGIAQRETKRPNTVRPLRYFFIVGDSKGYAYFLGLPSIIKPNA